MKKAEWDVDKLLEERILALPSQLLSRYKLNFKENGLVNIKDLLPSDLWDALVKETVFIAMNYGVERNIISAQSDYTKRALTTVGNEACRNNGPIMSAIYDSIVFHSFLSLIAGESVHMCHNEIEQLAISIMSEPGNTHGWHWDDCSFALIFMIDSPPAEYGGFTQLIPNTEYEKENCNIYETITRHNIQSHSFPTGSFYFFRSGTTLHRVHPLVKPTRRLIINMDFVSDEDLTRELDTSTTESFYN